MANYPANLPPFRVPLEIADQDGTIRSATDSGPGKVRRRFTATATYYNARVRMNGTEVGILSDFYRDTLAGGSLSFEMPDPVDDVTKSFRFRGPIEKRIVVGGTSAATRVYDVQMQLEKLP